MKKVLLLVVTMMLLSGTGCMAGESTNDEIDSQAKDQSSQSIVEPIAETEGDIGLEIDQEFLKDVVINFGAVEKELETGENVLMPQNVSLYYKDSLNENFLEPGDIFNWYIGYMLREDLTYEEKEEKYNNPLGEEIGWFFPAEYYEPTTMEFFDVTQEFLQRDETYYNKEHNGYTVHGGGGKGATPTITINEWIKNEDIVDINLNLFVENYEDRDMILTIKINDEGYYYVSYLPKE